MTGTTWFLKLGELSDASITGLTSTGFELIDCQYSFFQGVDHLGKAETRTHLAGISLVYDGLPSSEIIRWGMDSRIYLSGTFVLYDANNTPLENIFFEDGACTHMHISYTADGNSCAATKLTIHPRILKIDDDTFTQPWTISDISQSKKSTAPLIVDKIFQPIGKTNARLELGSATYELSEFNVSFNQSVDHKGQPTEDTTDGIISCVISERPSKELNKWAISSSQLMDGKIDFYQELQSSPLRILFTEAYCIEMTQFRHSTGEMRTRLRISANELDLNGKALFKNWNL